MEHRHYEVTINYYTETDLEELYNVLNKKSVDYYAWCFEGTPCEAHHPHIHASIHFKSSVKETAFRNYFTKKHHTSPVHNAKHLHEYIRGYEKTQGEWKLKCSTCSHDEENGKPVNVYFTLGEIPETGKKKAPSVTQKIVTALQEGKDINQIEALFPAYMMTNRRHVEKWIRDHKPEYKTKYYQYAGDYDIIEVTRDKWPDAKIAYITDLNELGKYLNIEYDTLLIKTDYLDFEYMQWPNGYPMSFKYGYEYIPIRVKRVIIVTKELEILLHYKLLISNLDIE